MLRFAASAFLLLLAGCSTYGTIDNYIVVSQSPEEISLTDARPFMFDWDFEYKQARMAERARRHCVAHDKTAYLARDESDERILRHVYECR